MKNNNQSLNHHQTGSFLTLILAGLLAVGILATLAYGTYYQIARGTQDTVLRAQSSALLTQAAYMLATEATDSDGDGISEPPAGGIILDNGWEIPATSGAPKTDAWGNPLKYCPWDNGTTNISSGRLAGANPALPGSTQFCVVSAGPDRTFNTTCNQAKNAALGDDGVRVMTIAQLNMGVGGTLFYGDPVASITNLPASGSQRGIMRIVRDTQIPYLWNGSAWIPLIAVAVSGISSEASCAAYPAGALGRDAADALHICGEAVRIWKPVAPN